MYWEWAEPWLAIWPSKSVPAAHHSQHSGSTVDWQQKGRDRQCRNKRTNPQNQKEKPTLRDFRACSFQAVIYLLILQAPQEQAYQGTGGVTDRVYCTGVDNCLVALAMSGQQHTVMPLHRRWQTVCLAERGEGRSAGKEAQQGEGL